MNTSRLAMAMFVTALGFATPAAAQEIGRRLHVGLVTPLFSYTTTTLEDEATSAEVDTTAVSWGPREQVALAVGYGLTEMLVIAGVLEVGGSSTEISSDTPGVETQKTNSGRWFVGPRFDVVLSPGSEVRPFASVTPGLLVSWSDVGEVDTSSMGFELQLQGGVRWFPLDGFSIDPSIGVAWSTSSGEVEVAGMSRDTSDSGISFAVAVGFSAWIP
jgi:hypothetical protein